MINRSVLTGRLTKDPELRYTTNGTAVASFALAVDRQFKNQDGEREADFINCVIWRKRAEALANYAHKGSLIGIEGRLQTRSYEKDNGDRVYVTELVVDNFAFLDSRNQNSDGSQQGQQSSYQGQQNNQYQTGPQQSQNGYNSQPQGNTPQPPVKPQAQAQDADPDISDDISDDDLPF